MNRAKNRKYHYIYKITRFDGMYYIGMHSTDNLDDGYFGSGQRLWKSIHKHGKDKHSKEILEFLPSREELAQREKELVCKELLEDVLCMNMTLGGTGGWANNPNSLKALLDPAVKKKAAERGNATLRERRKIPEYAERYSRNMSEALKGKQPWLGRNHSDETKAKLKVSMKGLQDGEKNSSFGTCWVIRDEKPIKIKKEKLDEYLNEGYHRGRIAPVTNANWHSYHV